MSRATQTAASLLDDDRETADPGHSKQIALATLDPLAIDAEQFASLIGVSRAMFFKLAEKGQIGPAGVRLGRAIRYPMSEVRAWVDAGMPPRQTWAKQRGNGT